MIRRKKQDSGFTLIELMVVILILGVLISVLFFGVLPAIQGSRAKLDATALSDFKQSLDLAMSEGQNETNITKFNGGATANKQMTGVAFLQGLVKRRIVPLDKANKLVGGTGTKPSDEEWDKEGAVSATTNVVFTCPNTGDAFVTRARARKGTAGVFMCHNVHAYVKYAQDAGIVALICGKEQAALYKLLEFQDTLTPPEGKVAPTMTAEKSDFYGKWPFEGLPEA